MNPCWSSSSPTKRSVHRPQTPRPPRFYLQDKRAGQGHDPAQSPDPSQSPDPGQKQSNMKHEEEQVLLRSRPEQPGGLTVPSGLPPSSYVSHQGQDKGGSGQSSQSEEGGGVSQHTEEAGLVGGARDDGQRTEGPNMFLNQTRCCDVKLTAHGPNEGRVTNTVILTHSPTK